MILCIVCIIFREDILDAGRTACSIWYVLWAVQIVPKKRKTIFEIASWSRQAFHLLCGDGASLIVGVLWSASVVVI